MTDPIVQDQNQNGQNPQTTQTVTPEIDFDLNLPTNEIVSKEEPAVALDFSDLDVAETPTTATQETQPKAEDLQQNIINSIDNISLGQSAQEAPIQETVEIQPEVITQPEVVEATPEVVQPIQEVKAEVVETKQEDDIANDEVIEAKPEIVEAQPEPVVNPIDEIATQLPPQPQEEVLQQTETKDNRLEQEDALIAENKEPAQEATPVIENKEIPEIKEEVLNVFDETPKQAEPEITITNENNPQTPETSINNSETSIDTTTPDTQNQTLSIQSPIQVETTQWLSTDDLTTWWSKNPTQNAIPTTNFQQDQAIIQQLQASAGKSEEPVSIVQVTPAPTEVNLDDLLGSPVSQQTVNNQNQTVNIPANNPTFNMTTGQQNPTQNTMPTQSTIPAFTGIQGYALPPIASQISEHSKLPFNKKILINFWIGVVAFLIGGFMFKTMYPLEYQKMMGGTWETNIENALAVSTGAEDTTDIDQLNGSGSTDGLFENPALANYHGSAEDFSGAENSWFNAFEDIEETMAQDETKTKEQLQNYIDQGKKYLVMGKKTNDKETTKYGLFLYKKASALLVDIENGTQISTDEINTQLADFETYLQKLTGSWSNDEMISTQQTTPTPEEFFWSGDTSTNEKSAEPISSEIPTTTQSGTTTPEETQAPAENVSGDQNSITQPNELNW